MRDLTPDEQLLAYRFAHLQLPEDAIDCEPWWWCGGEDWRRYFITREWEVSGLWVSVAGEQNHRGKVTRWLHVGGEDQCSTSERSRLITALVDAGRLLDALNATGMSCPDSEDTSRLPAERRTDPRRDGT